MWVFFKDFNLNSTWRLCDVQFLRRESSVVRHFYSEKIIQWISLSLQLLRWIITNSALLVSVILSKIYSKTRWLISKNQTLKKNQEILEKNNKTQKETLLTKKTHIYSHTHTFPAQGLIFLLSHSLSLPVYVFISITVIQKCDSKRILKKLFLFLSLSFYVCK